MRVLDKPRERVVVTLHGIEVPKIGYLGSATITAMDAGKFEAPVIRAALGCVQPDDKIVEIGAGTGVVGALIAQRFKTVKVSAFEMDPKNVTGIKGLYKHNKLTGRIKVQNNAVVSDTKAPKKVDLRRGDDSQEKKSGLKKTTVSSAKKTVASLQYDKLRLDFPHNVLILSMDGQEADFLKHAVLDDVDLVIVKLDHEALGREGLRATREYLECQGFIKDNAFSAFRAVTYKRAQRMYPVDTKPPLADLSESAPVDASKFEIDPRRNVRGDIIKVENAVLAHQPGTEGWRINATVFDGEKNPVPEAICWHGREEPVTMPRQHPRKNRLQHLPGTWLFGGCYNPHFGHFLVETLSRVWALDHIDEKIEGVLFFPIYSNHVERAPKDFDKIFSILDIDFNWKIVDQFYQVDRLIIPPQGSGIKHDMSSVPEYRDFLRSHIRKDLEPIVNEKLYVSRSEITGVTGRGLVGEKRLEAYLEKEGYLIFHPQNHSFQDQLRHYQGAQHILGPDGSPFHLANLVGHPEKKVGIIQRRISVEHSAWADQMNWFEAGEPLDLACCKTYWAPAGVKRAKLQMSGEVQFSKICKVLREAGLIGAKAKWPDMTKEQLNAELAALGALLGSDMHQVHLGHQSLQDYPVLENEKTPQVFWHDA